MNWLNEIFNNRSLYEKLSSFLSVYGTSGLDKALTFYADMQQDYVCKTKTSTTRLKIADILYLEIHQHTITAYTAKGTYHKYGSLNHELSILSRYEFVRCSKNCIVSLVHIESVSANQILLTNQEVLHMSRSFAPKVLAAFHNYLHK